MRICVESAPALLAVCLIFQVSPTPTAGGEIPAGAFTVLFDGKNLKGWKNPGNWEIEADGSVFRKSKGGSLVYVAEKMPDDFELRFEWKVGPGGNSGIYYRPTQYEYQILDNQRHPNGKNPRTTAASLYFCMAPSRDATKPVGQWNSGRIVCQGSIIQHWLNGEKVVAFDYHDPRWAAQVALLRARGGNLEARGAHLSLQDHGDPVWYRNIRLRKISGEDRLDPTPVTPAPVPAKIQAAEKKKVEAMQKKRDQAKQAGSKRKQK